MLNLENEDIRIIDNIYKVNNTNISIGYIQKFHMHCIIKSEKIDSIDEANSIYHEAFSLVSLHHPNLIKVYNCLLIPKKSDNQKLKLVNIILEHCDNNNLVVYTKKLLKRKITLNEETILYYLYQAVEAFNFLQQKKIAHRDVKPENVLVTENGKKIKICDFETCMKIDQMTLSLKGTPNYLSPLLREGYMSLRGTLVEKIHHDAFKSDVFSLGLTFLSLIVNSFNAKEYSDINELEKTIFQRLKQVNNTFFKRVLESMLIFNEFGRPDFQELSEILKVNFQYNEEKFCVNCYSYKFNIEFVYTRGSYYCRPCSESIFQLNEIKCSKCNIEHIIDQIYLFNKISYCSNCLQIPLIPNQPL